MAADASEHAEVVADLERQRRFLLEREESMAAQLTETQDQLAKARKAAAARCAFCLSIIPDPKPTCLNRPSPPPPFRFPP
jgi:hypothetical protein